MGFIDDDNKIIIHKLQCSVADHLKSSYGSRVLAAKWNMNRTLLFPASIYLKGLDKMGLLNQITQVISQLRSVNMKGLSLETDMGLFEGKIEIYVHDVQELNEVIRDLRKIDDIKEVVRV